MNEESKEDTKLNSKEEKKSWGDLSGDEKWKYYFRVLIVLSPLMVFFLFINNKEAFFKFFLSLIISIKEWLGY